ncbi:MULTISPECIES: alpha/beta-hydrolase family protein [unclassified Rhodococcus (in: high G+C Gram-positive bacteria)]|uniref:alpha/beta-hydrolase family protein n=1 Tax=unclassified Rhodococcus (in: high G+C Gram-positive bacteria) TaxID=192944 RepID=UPI001446E343|nr:MULTISPECIES: alpha/beta-hydrolase family protein [unclassified Rhodococcus (in: high G+C Gram-positive bacteria)]
MTTSVRLRPTAALRTAPEPRLAVPRVTTSLIVGGMVAASLAPGLLPRLPLTQALVTGVLAALGLGLSAGLHRFLRRLVPIAPQCGARAVSAAASVVSVAVAGAVDARWQSSLRSSMGMPAASRLHWIEVLCGSVSVSAILIVLFLATTRGYLRLGRVKTIVVLTVFLLCSYFIAVPMAFSSLAERSVVANSLVGTSLPIPQSSTRSGSAASLITWNDLGREGRIFAAGGTDLSTVRAYIGVQASTDVEAGAELAVRELDRAGGFDRSHIVVAVPTGSGWIDENAVTGLETRFDGDVATVAAQYSYEPSWSTFLFAQPLAEASATALLEAVSRRIGEVPLDARPNLYLYGQSLGAIGGSSAAAVLEGTTTPTTLCGALWAGPPAHEVIPGNAKMMANTSDPVIWWSTALVGSKPDLSFARRDAPIPRWIPVVSFVQTTVDLFSALGVPAGHGHRYGTDQGTSMPGC